MLVASLVIFGGMFAFAFQTRAETFVTGGRPLSFYGMNADTAIHGASAVPLNQQSSATQYYNGLYTGNPNYYIATNKSGNEIINPNNLPNLQNIPSPVASYSVSYPGTSYNGRSDTSAVYSGLVASAGLMNSISPVASPRVSSINQVSSVYYGGYTPPGPHYGALTISGLALSQPVVIEKTAVQKEPNIAEDKTNSVVAKLNQNLINDPKSPANEDLLATDQVVQVGYIDYMKNRYGIFWKGVLGN